MRVLLWFPVCLVALAGCGKKEVEPPPPVPVRVGSVASQNVQQIWRYSGEIQPNIEVKLAFKQSGYVASLHHVRGLHGMRDVQAGDRVPAETVLASLRRGELESSVQQATGQVATAKGQLEASSSDQKKADLEFQRAQSLYAAKAMTKPDYDNAVAQHEQAAAKIVSQKGQIEAAEGQIRMAQINLGDANLRTLMPAVLISKEVEPGTLVSPGTVGFTVADTRTVKVAFGVPDTLLPQFSMGMTVPVTVEGVGGDPLPGRVSGIGAAANSDSRVFNIEVNLPNTSGALKSGMIATVQIQQTVGTRILPVVPVAALSTAQSGSSAYSVFVVTTEGDKQVAHLRSVRVGRITDRSVVIEQGLTPGERIIVERTNQLSDGSAVRAVN